MFVSIRSTSRTPGDLLRRQSLRAFWHPSPGGASRFVVLAMSALMLIVAAEVRAQVPPPPMDVMAPAAVMKSVGVDQKIGDNIDLNLRFRNEAGEEVQLKDYFGKKPVLLTLVYYECPGLCTMVLNGVQRSLKPLSFTIGQEFDVLTISFDPKETSQLASKKKELYVKAYNRPGAEQGWNFLVGQQESIDAITKAVGFRYAWDEKTNQFAHAAAIILITPQGKISKYFYGLEYSSNDIRLGVMEASEERVGTLADHFVLLCYQYDPRSGKYSFAIFRVLQYLAGATLVGLGGWVFFMFRRDRGVVSPKSSV